MSDNEQPAVAQEDAVTPVPKKISHITTITGSSKKPVTTSNKKPMIKPVPMIGLYNKTGYNVHVIFKNCDIVIPPKGRTTKKYLQSDIVSVQNTGLQQAIANGIVTILR